MICWSTEVWWWKVTVRWGGRGLVGEVKWSGHFPVLHPSIHRTMYPYPIHRTISISISISISMGMGMGMGMGMRTRDPSLFFHYQWKCIRRESWYTYTAVRPSVSLFVCVFLRSFVTQGLPSYTYIHAVHTFKSFPCLFFFPQGWGWDPSVIGYDPKSVWILRFPSQNSSRLFW